MLQNAMEVFSLVDKIEAPQGTVRTLSESYQRSKRLNADPLNWCRGD
jgi:hypothetical protein